MQNWINPATLAIACILATVGAVVWVAIHRHTIWPELVQPPVRRRQSAASRYPVGRQYYRARTAKRQPLTSEMASKRAELVSLPVSGFATHQIDSEMVSLRVVAKLVKAGVITQTIALESAFDVKAGSSKRYTSLVEKYKQVAAELDKSSEKNSTTTAQEQSV